jgi:Cadherin domain/Abnormal spindle-like microcephaly-assoc'd, ASPM-SPD-2-Hydin
MGGVLTEDQIRQYMGLCGKLCQSNGVRRISYFYYSAWQANHFARIRASYQGPVGAVTPGRQDFGTVPVGQSAQRVFTLQNVGTESLTITPSCNSPFSVVSPAGSVVLAAGQSAQVTIAYSPTAQGPIEQKVQFQTAEGTIERSVSGTGTPPNNPPTDIALAGTSVQENQPAGTSVGTFSTTDPDAGNTFTYTLVSGSGSTDNAAFTISGSSLRTAASFNYESRTSYSIRIRTTDQAGLWYEEPFTITVLNVNEQPTDIALSGSSVLENQPSGTTVGTLNTTDPDAGNTFVYALVSETGSGDNASFTISGSALQTAASFDYEARNSYSVRVRSTDQGGLWFEEVFTISVTDVAEPPATPSNVSPLNGATNQPLTLTLQTSTFSDPDNGDIHAATQWIVRRLSDNVVVLDSGEDTANKTTRSVSNGVLANSTAYGWQVRYKDNRGLWSSYSTQTTFTTGGPQLQGTRLGTNIVISWPTNDSAFKLFYATNLPATTWISNPVAPTIMSGQYTITNSMTNNARFYRLKK